MGANRPTVAAKARKKRRIKNDRIIAQNKKKKAAEGTPPAGK